jgi:hypothetical protein
MPVPHNFVEALLREEGAMSKKEKCKHLLCDCEIDPKHSPHGPYCSEVCAEGHMEGGHCNCGHPSCK